ERNRVDDHRAGFGEVFLALAVLAARFDSMTRLLAPAGERAADVAVADDRNVHDVAPVSLVAAARDRFDCKEQARSRHCRNALAADLGLDHALAQSRTVHATSLLSGSRGAVRADGGSAAAP